MTAKTLVALKGSILKWEKIVRSTRGVDRGQDNCALCKEFPGRDYHGNCTRGGEVARAHADKPNSISVRCPVARRRGHVGCQGTPYIQWANHQDEKHGFYADYHRIPGCAECLKLARAERDFLKSLLPTKRKRP